MAISAPTTQPTMASGPVSTARISGIVMNGPIPTIWDMFRAVAGNKPMARTNPPLPSGWLDIFVLPTTSKKWLVTLPQALRAKQKPAERARARPAAIASCHRHLVQAARLVRVPAEPAGQRQGNLLRPHDREHRRRHLRCLGGPRQGRTLHRAGEPDVRTAVTQIAG